VTPTTDVFAWGAAVAYAGTGRHPFGTGEPGEVRRRVRSGRPDLRGLDGPLRGLVAAAMDRDPARRPTARQLLDRLVGAPTADRVTPSSRRRRASAALTVLTALAAVGALVAAATLYLRPPPDGTAAGRQPATRGPFPVTTRCSDSSTTVDHAGGAVPVTYDVCLVLELGGERRVWAERYHRPARPDLVTRQTLLVRVVAPCAKTQCVDQATHERATSGKPAVAGRTYVACVSVVFVDGDKILNHCSPPLVP
jgi:hypothetical protein